MVIWFCAILLVSTIAIIFSTTVNPSESRVDSPLYTTNDPIYIYGNANFTAENGVTGGAGTQIDPYIIENWDINAFSANGIEIRNTTAYFKIRNCYIHEGGYSYDGIYFYNVWNGQLENTISSNNYRGICLHSSSNSNISNNSADLNNYRGIYLSHSSNNTVSNNSASNNYDGIALYSSSYNNIINNNADSNSYYGIYLGDSSNNTLVNNTLKNDGIFIEGYKIEYFNTHNIYTTNTANGKPIYYYKNQNDINIDGWSAGQVILANCTNFTIKNVDYSNADVGVQLAYCDYCSIDNSIFDSELYGIYLYSSSNNSMSNNRANSNNNYGIYLFFSSYNAISNNSADLNNYRGIYLSHSSNNTIFNNSASKNRANGIYMGSSTNNTVSNNIVSDNYESIALYSSSYNDVFNNTVLNNRYGFYLSGASNNNVYNNNALNNLYGIHLYYSSNNNIFNNSANSNNLFGIYLSSSSNNTISDNNASNNDYGIHLWKSSNNTISDNNASNNDYGIYIYSSSNNNIFNNSANSNNWYGIVLQESNNNTLGDNTFENDGIFIRGYGVEHFNTHNINTTNTANDKPVYYHKNQKDVNIDGWSAGQIILANCTNFTIKNMDCSNASVGVQLGFCDHCSIENSMFNNETCSIYLEYSSYNNISNNSALKNRYSISLDSSNNNKILNNNAPNNDYGIRLHSSSYNSIYNNNVNSNNWFGVYLKSSSDNDIYNNSASNNGNGIWLDSSSNNNVSNNSVNSNDWWGIYLLESNNNSMFNNSVNLNNDYGIYMSSSSYSTLVNNTLENDGIFIWGDTADHFNTHNIDTTNTANDKPVYYHKNQKDVNIDGWSAGQIILANCTNFTIKNMDCSNASVGVQLGFCDFCSIENSVFNNESHGVYLYHSDHNTISNNIASNNSYGIRLEDSNNNTISDNGANSNNAYGIKLVYSNYNDIDDNSVNSNGYEGIGLYSSSNNIISNNSANSNSWYSIHLTYSGNNKISNNCVGSNNWFGIYLGSSSNNIISNNNVSNNHYGIYLGGTPWNYSNNNIFNFNSICYNNHSLEIYDSYCENNIFHHNNLFNGSVVNIVDNGLNTKWDDGYDEGNYWSNYIGLDDGSNGRIAGDGVGDTNIPHMGLDNYPLMEPWIPPDTTPPTITDVTAIPDPQEIFGYVNISVNVSDNVDVDSVLIGIIDPNGGVVGNFTMSYGSVNDRYYSNQTYDIVGTYQFVIGANDTSNNWNFSSGQFTMQDTTPPVTPTGLTVTDVPNDEGGALNITWNANAEPDFDHYTLYSNKTGSWTFVADIPTGTEYYIDTGLTDGTRHYYNISASDDASNESPQSATTSGVPADNLPPATPTGLIVSDVPNDEDGVLNITWHLNLDDTVVYSLYSNGSGSWQFLANIIHPKNWYVDTGLTNDVKYYYKISAWDEVPNESPLSDAVYGIPIDNLPPATPTGLTVTLLRSGDLNITWNLNTDDTQTYSIYSNKTGTWTLLMNITHPQNSYVDTGLTSGTTYYYRISAWDEVPLESSESEAVYGVSSPMGTISGIVKDKDGNPIEGANVTVYESGTTTDPVNSTITNNDGKYSIDIPPGIYDVKIEKSGYETQWKKDVEVTADQTTTADFILPLTSDILGDYWWIILIIIIIIIIGAVAWMLKRKKGKELE